MRILITGASGLLGLNLSLIALKSNHEVIGWLNTKALRHAPFPVESVDLLDLDTVEAKIETVAPDLIIHCAAVANLETAEANPDLADRVNALAASEIARVATKNSIHMVHISTDAVFDGTKGDYNEEDIPSPINIYAKSKLAGEWAVEEVNPDAIIARVNFYGWSLSGERSLAEFFFNHLREGIPIKGFTDAFFCPLYVGHLAEILLEMVERGLSGLYHVVSPEKMSKHDFGVSIARKFGFDESLITPASVQDAGLSAARSPKLTLRTDKLQAALGRSMPDQTTALEAFYQSWQAGLPDTLKACL